MTQAATAPLPPRAATDRLEIQNLDLALLVSATLAVALAFSGALACSLISYDDADYVTKNAAVQAGLNPKSIAWAFQGFHAGFYFPLTWLSLMADVSVFGAGAPGHRLVNVVGGHHLVNVILHLLNGLLLYTALRLATKDLPRSALVALLFLVHPLRVESVVWVTERKDVLAAFFGLIGLVAYVSYVRSSDARAYWIATTAFGLSLLCKQMLVSLPIVLLLLDYWPLKRFQTLHWRNVKPCLIEKVPMLFLSVTASAIALWAAREAGSVLDASIEIPFQMRLANAVGSYVIYMGKLFWWKNLAVFYPYPSHFVTWKVVLCVLLLLSLTLTALRWRRQMPWLTVGWLWYLLAFVPMIGLIQSGDQAMADRFTYFPMIGLVMAIVWTVPSRFISDFRYVRFTASLVAFIIAFLAIQTRQQVAYWNNDLSLFSRAIEVTHDNGLAHAILGRAYRDKSDDINAMIHLTEAVRLMPRNAILRLDLGIELVRLRQPSAALIQFERAIELEPGNPDTHFDLGLTLERTGNLPEARLEFLAALRLAPEHAGARSHLARLDAQRSIG